MRRAWAGFVAAAALVVAAPASADQGSSQVQIAGQACQWARDMAAAQVFQVWSCGADPASMWWDPGSGSWGAHAWVYGYDTGVDGEFTHRWDCLAMPGWTYCEGRGTEVVWHAPRR